MSLKHLNAISHMNLNANISNLDAVLPESDYKLIVLIELILSTNANIVNIVKL